MRRTLSSALGVLLVALLLFWAAIGYRLATTPTNHWGVDVRAAAPGAVLLVALGIARLRYEQASRPSSAGVVLFGLLSLFGLFELDQHNILVEYERWIERGMPDRWQRVGR